MFIKMCGMTRPQDIAHAARIGAHAVGFIFAPSPRKVTAVKAFALTDQADALLKVGVFVDEDIHIIKNIQRLCKLDIIQLHGNESPEYCHQLGGRIFKAFRLKDESLIQHFSDYPDNVKILVDAWDALQAGGTGKQISFNLLDQIRDFSRIIIAGGVGLENVVKIAQTYHPFGVDVNSKIEKSPGIKDHKLMTRFVEIAAHVDE